MKKLIVILFLSMFIISNVYADDYTTEIIENKQIENIQKRYKWYKKEYEYLGYKEKIDKGGEFYYQNLDNNKIKYSDYKIYNNQNLDDNYIIQDMYEYYKAKKINYIKIINKNTENKDVYISELKIVDNQGNKIDYQVYDFISCEKVTLEYINDDITNSSQKTRILNGGVIVLKLEQEYDIEDINVDIYINSTFDVKKSLLIDFFPKAITAYKTYCKKLVDYSHIISENEKQDEILNVKFDDDWDMNFDYDLIELYTEIIEDKISLTSKFEKQKYYRKVTKLYPTYKINIKYIDGYYTNLDGYYKDENNYMIYYKYINDNNINSDIISSNIIDNSETLDNTNNTSNIKIENSKNTVTSLVNKNINTSVNSENKKDNSTVYKYITKYKIRYKYINYLTIISILLNILLIMFIIYKKIKNRI